MSQELFTVQRDTKASQKEHFGNEQFGFQYPFMQTVHAASRNTA